MPAEQLCYHAYCPPQPAAKHWISAEYAFSLCLSCRQQAAQRRSSCWLPQSTSAHKATFQCYVKGAVGHTAVRFDVTMSSQSTRLPRLSNANTSATALVASCKHVFHSVWGLLELCHRYAQLTQGRGTSTVLKTAAPCWGGCFLASQVERYNAERRLRRLPVRSMGG